MLPLSLLNTAKGHPMLVEMKNGDTYNGRLVNCNVFMNLLLKDVICTSKVRHDLVTRLNEVYKLSAITSLHSVPVYVLT